MIKENLKMLKRLLCLCVIISTFFSGCRILPSKESSETEFLLDTVCTIRVGGKDVEVALAKAFDRIREIQAETDYYSASSDVSRINSGLANTEISVSKDTASIIKTALEVSEKSNGAFDITIAPIKDVWEFKSGDHMPPTKDEIDKQREFVSYKNIEVDVDSCTVSKKDDNTHIDLGGCAKGYASDMVAEVIKSFDIDYAIIDLGGNVATYGKNKKSVDGKWSIGIQKPFSDNGELEKTVSVGETAVVTSGVYQRYFKWEDKLYHHIINPDTGYPTDNGVLSATVIAKSACLADCLSTASVVLGREKAKALCDKFGAELFVINNDEFSK